MALRFAFSSADRLGSAGISESVCCEVGFAVLAGPAVVDLGAADDRAGETALLDGRPVVTDPVETPPDVALRAGDAAVVFVGRSMTDPPGVNGVVVGCT